MSDLDAHLSNIEQLVKEHLFTAPASNAAPPPEAWSGNTRFGDYVGQASPWLGAQASKAERLGGLLADSTYDIVRQPVTAGEALSEAASKPNIPNVANAAYQTSLGLFRPQAALISLLGGYGGAALHDAGLAPFPDEAQAKDAKIASLAPQLPGLSQVESDKLARLEKRYEEDRGSVGRDERAEMQRLRDLSSQATSAANAQALASKERMDAANAQEYGRAVNKAEVARDTELARNKRFSDTDFGKLYDKTGGGAAFAGALGFGALGRAAHGGGSFLKEFGLPALEGTGAAYTANSLPNIYDYNYTSADNPEKAAYRAYARELPPGHPRKEEFAKYAESLPDENPVVTAARHKFVDDMWPRIGMSALEGITGGISGANGPKLLSRMFGGSAAREGAAAANSNEIGQAGTAGSTVSVAPSLGRAAYPSEGSPGRQNIRDAYRTAVTESGQLPQPSAMSKALQGSIFDNAPLPSITSRVAETNKAVEAFRQINGRMPMTRAEFENFVFRHSKTLGLSSAAILGAQQYNENGQ
ncbi:MAG: hypothetical protein KGL35_22620 [Bradyrhizobium sp.]|nr:hypothetical protein [Bradyrhizobium sp.]